MKRAISIFFVLLANMVILAHAIVPHHHHNKIFVAIVNVLDDDAQGKLNHFHSGTTHEHGSHSEECAIDDTLAAVVSQLQKDNSFDSGTFDFDSHSDLFVTDIVTLNELKPIGKLPFLFQPYTAGIHLDYVARSIGLRAPPTC